MKREERSIYIDEGDGLGRVRGNRSLYKRMLALYLQSEEFPALEDAAAAKDYPRVAELAHGIRGMSGNLGLKCVFQLSAEIMLRVREDTIDGQLLAEFFSAAEATRRHVELLIAELE